MNFKGYLKESLSNNSTTEKTIINDYIKLLDGKHPMYEGVIGDFLKKIVKPSVREKVKNFFNNFDSIKDQISYKEKKELIDKIKNAVDDPSEDNIYRSIEYVYDILDDVDKWDDKDGVPDHIPAYERMTDEEREAEKKRVYNSFTPEELETYEKYVSNMGKDDDDWSSEPLSITPSIRYMLTLSNVPKGNDIEENTSDPDDIPGTFLKKLSGDRIRQKESEKKLRAKEWVEKEGLYTELQKDYKEYKKDMEAEDMEVGSFDDFIVAMYDMAHE